jgi:ABC-type dipeptide/oligopeptide/nickel transport system permease subunit
MACHFYTAAPGLTRGRWPAVELSLAVFGFNMLGDGLRDLLDPRLKGG